MIKDSGNRTAYETGAVRDLKEGKGRFDLMPLMQVADIYDDAFLKMVARGYEHKSTRYLAIAINEFVAVAFEGNFSNAMLEVAVHFEEGAKKYGENNWQKGIPVSSYIDSAVRHYFKFLRSDEDERHDRAVLWNLLCCMYEIDRLKEGNTQAE